MKKFGLEKAKHCDTPMSTTLKLSKDASGKDVGQSLYRGMIDRLLYLTASRPDITFSVAVCARYQANPKESHLVAVKRIIQFVNGTSTMGFGTLLTLIQVLLDIEMPIEQEIVMIGKAHRAVAFSLGRIWFLGLVRNKTHVRIPIFDWLISWSNHKLGFEM